MIHEAAGARPWEVPTTALLHPIPPPSRVTPPESVGHQRPGFQMGQAADGEEPGGGEPKAPHLPQHPELEPCRPVPTHALSRPPLLRAGPPRSGGSDPPPSPSPSALSPRPRVACPARRMQATLPNMPTYFFQAPRSRATGRGPGGVWGLPASLKAHYWRPCPCSVGWYLV